MKKILVVLFTLGLLFTITTWAGASSLYLGTLIYGTYHETTDELVSGTEWGGNFLLGEKYTIKFDYLAGGNEDSDYNILNWDLMFGYRVVSNDQLDFDISLGYGVSNFYDSPDWEATSILLGLDLTVHFAERLSCSAAIYRSLTGDMDAADDYAIIGYRVNFEYLYYPTFGLNFGWRDFINSAAGGTNDYGVQQFAMGFGFHF